MMDEESRMRIIPPGNKSQTAPCRIRLGRLVGFAWAFGFVASVGNFCDKFRVS